MIVLLMSPKNRRYPGIMSVFMAIAGIFICLPFLVGSVTGIEEFLCKDEFTRADFDDGLCVWQACFLLFGYFPRFFFTYIYIYIYLSS